MTSFSSRWSRRGPLRSHPAQAAATIRSIAADTATTSQRSLVDVVHDDASSFWAPTRDAPTSWAPTRGTLVETVRAVAEPAPMTGCMGCTIFTPPVKYWGIEGLGVVSEL